MDTATCIELGIIQRKQGLEGKVVAWLRQELPPLDVLGALFIQLGHTLVPYGIEHVSQQPGKAVIKLQGVDDAQTAHALKGRLIFVPRELFKASPSQKMRLEQLVGYAVADVTLGSLGTVQAIYTPAQQSLLVLAHQGRELLVPYHDAIVTQINHAQQNIVVQLPKGFLEAAY